MTAPLVILGSGLAGYSVARELRKLDAATPIVLVTEDGGDFYSKPMLSNAFALKRAPETIATSTAGQMAAQLNVTVRTHTVAHAFDPAQRRITLDGDALEYQKLILAIGARPVRLTESAQTEGVHAVNTLDDYRRFRKSLEGCRRVVILGAGFIGCEFANDLKASGFDVDVVDLAPRALQRFWPAPMAQMFEARLASIGVRWHLGVGIAAICREAAQSVVELADGKVLTSDIVLSALGLAPRTDLARAAGLRVNRGIAVDAYLCASQEDIYALGDCAEVQGQVLPFVMPIMHCGRALARTLTGIRTVVAYPAMPVVLKTPACPAVFLPPPAQRPGEWRVESERDDMTALYHTDDGELAGAALLGAAVARRDEWVRRLTPR